MTPERLRALLERLQAGEATVDEAMASLQELPYRELGLATIDHHRALRQGVPEVVFGETKTVEQILAIAEAIVDAGQPLLVTRIDEEKALALQARFDGVAWSPAARTARLEASPAPRRPCPPVAVVSAGTSDIPVAEEACETLDAVGLEVDRIYDVGVAGLHRLLGHLDRLTGASAVIVVAGMEGALPSVVGGLVANPVVAVPTSVGYGTALGGLTALMGMLTSCASGLAVVNIDNGFGAAMILHRLLPRC